MTKSQELHCKDCSKWVLTNKKDRMGLCAEAVRSFLSLPSFIKLSGRSTCYVFDTDGTTANGDTCNRWSSAFPLTGLSCGSLILMSERPPLLIFAGHVAIEAARKIADRSDEAPQFDSSVEWERALHIYAFIEGNSPALMNSSLNLGFEIKKRRDYSTPVTVLLPKHTTFQVDDPIEQFLSLRS